MVSGFDAEGAARRGVRAGRHQLRPRDRGPRATRRADDRRRAKSRGSVQSGVLFGCSRTLALRLRGRWYRYGYACVSFGKPISLRQYVTERGIDFRTLDQPRRFAEIERLGDVLMDEGRRSGAGAAGVAGGDRAARSRRAALGARTEGARARSRATARASGAHVHIPRADQDYAIEVGLRMLRLRHLVEETERALSRQSRARIAAALLRQLDRASARRRAGRTGGGMSAAHSRRF